MLKENQLYKILVVEDNLGDYVLVEEYIKDKFLRVEIENVKSYKEFVEIIHSNHNFDIIFLDLTLPDKFGLALIEACIALVDSVPIVVLTGYTDTQFGIKSLSLGVSDYLIKDELDAASLYKCILYNIERKKTQVQLESSEKRYNDLFHLSPIPMWVYDTKTLRFLDVNIAAERHYGYTFKEFMEMSVMDIRPKEDIPIILEKIKSLNENEPVFSKGIFRHLKKNGEIIYVEIQSNTIIFHETVCRLILASDVTERFAYIEAIEKQNKKLKEIAWIQSHLVRAPLARIMGLINLLLDDYTDEINKKSVSKMIMESSVELDSVIRDIVNKTNDM